MAKVARAAASDDEEQPRKKKVIKKKVGPRTDPAAVRRVIGSMGGDNKWWKPQGGSNRIRVLPYDSEDGNFFFHSVLHHGFRDSEGNRRAYPCLARLNKKDKCPVCQVIGYYDNASDTDITKIMQEIRPAHNYLMNVINRKDANAKVQMYSATPTVARVLVNSFAEEDFGDITDPKQGRDVLITATGERLTRRYEVQISPRITPIGLDAWETVLYDLAKEAYREIPTYKAYVGFLYDSFGDQLNLGKIFGPAKRAVADEEEEAEEEAEEMEDEEELDEEDEDEEEDDE